MTQEATILKHLKKHKSITTMEAFMSYGITRLASRIYDLRSQGEKIGGYMTEVRNTQGEIVKVKRYYMGKS